MPLLNHKPKQGPDPKPEPGADRKRTGNATVTLLKSFISGSIHIARHVIKASSTKQLL